MLKTYLVQDVVQKKVAPFGNSAMVILPRAWRGRRASVLLGRPLKEPKEAILEILEPSLERVQGVFLFGSHARREARENADIDALVVSEGTLRLPSVEGFEFFVKEKEEFIRLLKKDDSLFLYQMVQEAQPIVNGPLLAELKKIKVQPDFSRMLENVLGVFKLTEELLQTEENIGNQELETTACIYSLLLRLRSLIITKCFLEKKRYTNARVEKVLIKYGFTEKDIELFMYIYRKERDEEPVKRSVTVAKTRRLFNAVKEAFLEVEEKAARHG